MSIPFVILVLTYILFLVFAYGATLFVNLDEKTGERIISRAFRRAFLIFVMGLSMVYLILVLPHLTLDPQTASYLILASKCASILTLGMSLFQMRRKAV
jgi:hypothetical protein